MKIKVKIIDKIFASQLILAISLGFPVYCIAYVENECKQNGGSLNCVQPEEDPPEGNNYIYRWEANSMFYYDDDMKDTFSSVEEAIEFGTNYLEGAEQDWGYEPKGDWLRAYDFPNSRSVGFKILDMTPYFGYDINDNASLKNNKALSYKVFYWNDSVVNQYDLNETNNLYRVKPVSRFYCKPEYKKVLYSNFKDQNPGFLCYKERTIPMDLGCSASVGNPCSVTTGNKFLSETDWASANSPLAIKRFYNSLPVAPATPLSTYEPASTAEAAGWTHNYNLSLIIGEVQDTQLNIKPQLLDKPNSAIVLTRGDGKRVLAARDNTDTTIAGDSGWFINLDEGLRLNQINANKWQVTHVDTGTFETYQALNSETEFVITRINYLNGQFVKLDYDSQGRLITVTDQFGRTLRYIYGGNGLNGLTAITLPNGEQITYTKQGSELTVRRPGYGTKTYLYDEPSYAHNPNGLITGIIDENGNRYATYTYDEQNRGISTEHADGSQKYTLTYGNQSTTVSTPYGGSKTYSLGLVSGQNKVIQASQSGDTVQNQYDQAGNLISQTDDGITTKYTYDVSRNLQTSQINAYGTPESTIILIEWANDLPVKTKITEGTANTDGTLNQALRITTFTYDDKGNVLTKTITDPNGEPQTARSRTWVYTYNQYSQKLSETDPQGRTQTWDYDQSNGNLLSYTDIQSLTTTYSNHTSEGKPQTIVSSTGQTTTLTYDAAGRATEQKLSITTPKLNSLAKNKDGGIVFKNWWRKLFGMKLLPNPVKYDINQTPTQEAITTYIYNSAGQLVQTTLPDGEVITYTYDDAHRLIGMTDSLGNRIAYTLNAAGDITQTDSYDPQGQLAKRSQQQFDQLGRLEQAISNNGQYQTYGYDAQEDLNKTQDALGRVYREDHDNLGRITTSTDALGNQVSYTYNALGQLIAATDARGNTTSYSINAFGETTQVDSPDTGITTFIYGEQTGQLQSQTDSSGRVQQYDYDDDGRLTHITDANNQTIAEYTYDDHGRLNQLTNPNSTTVYTHDSAGRVIEKAQTLNVQTQTLRYAYTAGGKLKQQRLPSGKLVEYQYSDNGVLTGIEVKYNDTTTQLIDSLTYSPNGITGYNWSQTAQTVSHDYDLDGRLTKINNPALQRQYSYDAGNRITDILDSSSNLNFNYQHDKQDRLLSQKLNQGNDDTQLSYAYDKNSNRTQTKVSQDNAIDITNITYEPTSNRITDISYDASGRILNDGTRTYTYNTAGRIERIQNGATGIYNVYNPLGQRIQKNSGNAKTYFVYDEQGLLIGEYYQNNNQLREYVYLNGLPVAMFNSEKPDEVLNIHTDHLGTPRAVSNASSEILWRWEGDAFGNVNPQVSSITLPLRHAGQYEDKETGLFYNYFRFYDPKTGRYVTSDPIGLDGGMNTYGYVGSSPLHFIDPTGELFFVPAIPAAVQAATAAIAAGTACYATDCGQAAVNAMATVAKSVGDEFAKQSEYLRYKNYCNNPPPPTGDRCKDLKNNIEFHKTCADMRENWDNKFLPKRHEKAIRDHRRMERKYRKRLENAWDCREQCDD